MLSCLHSPDARHTKHGRLSAGKHGKNDPPGSQDLFDRKESRGRSEFDIRNTFVANGVYELPFGRRRYFGGWEISGVAAAHSNLPFTPVLSFDNADAHCGTAEHYQQPLRGCMSEWSEGGYSVMLV
jgi:hypothetical protein